MDTAERMQQLAHVAETLGARFFERFDDRIAEVAFGMGDGGFYARFEDGVYVVYWEDERGGVSAQAQLNDLDHALLKISLMADYGFDSKPWELKDLAQSIEADPSLSDERLHALLAKYVDPRYFSLGEANNANSVWLRLRPDSHDTAYRDPQGMDWLIDSNENPSEAGYDVRANDVFKVAGFAWDLQYSWARAMEWGFKPDDPQLALIMQSTISMGERLNA